MTSGTRSQPKELPTHIEKEFDAWITAGTQKTCSIDPGQWGCRSGLGYLHTAARALRLTSMQQLGEYLASGLDCVHRICWAVALGGGVSGFAPSPPPPQQHALKDTGPGPGVMLGRALGVLGVHGVGQGEGWGWGRPKALDDGSHPGGSRREGRKNCSYTKFSQKDSCSSYVQPWLVAVGGGWRLVVVGGGWWLVTGGWWRLAVVGGWSPLAVGGGWWLAVGGGWCLAAVGGWLLVVPRGSP